MENLDNSDRFEVLDGIFSDLEVIVNSFADNLDTPITNDVKNRVDGIILEISDIRVSNTTKFREEGYEDRLRTIIMSTVGTPLYNHMPPNVHSGGDTKNKSKDKARTRNNQFKAQGGW